MGSYNPPVAGLLKLGRPGDDAEPDYLAFGIGPEHVPDLIRMLSDKELRVDEPEFYAHIHAWTALAQLRAEEAIEPLLDLLAANAVARDQDWDDWTTNEVPGVLGQFGLAALTAAKKRLNELQSHSRVSDAYAGVLKEIAVHHPETRDEVIGQLLRILETAATNEPDTNGFVVAYLLDLKTTEAMPAIERTYATENVDEFICGDIDDVKYALGLGPKPPTSSLWPTTNSLPLNPTGQNARQRFNERQRKKKLEKKLKKKKRK